MRQTNGGFYRPDTQLQALRLQLRQLEDRYNEAVEDSLLEALIYERIALLRQQSACIANAKRDFAQRDAMQKEEFFP